MKVQDTAIGKIKPYGKNPRKNAQAVEKVANSIKAFGFKSPIIVDKDWVIIAGHTRLLAAKRLGLETVPVLVASDLSTEQCKAYRLADNKTAEFSEWDVDLLAQEIMDLQNADIDVECAGFSEKEIAAILNADNSLGDIPQAGEDSQEPVTHTCPKCGFRYADI